MEDTNQIHIPESFLALYKNVRTARLSLPWKDLLARYEYCEDLASMLQETARTMMFELHISEEDVFDRVHTGLQAPSSGTSPEEAFWVLRRLAELLQWHGSMERYRPTSG